MRSTVLVLCAGVWLASFEPAFGRQTRGVPPPPQFRTSIDIVHMDVSVLDSRRRPVRARRRTLSMTMLDRVLGILTRRTRWLARLSRRRWELVIQPRLIGLGVVLLALGLALPLPVPGSHLVFLIPLFMYSVGVLERDGLWIVLGHACALIDMALLVVFGATGVAVFARLWHWLA